MSDYVIFVSLALFWVYQQRHGRWTVFLGALEGKYVLPSPESQKSS